MDKDKYFSDYDAFTENEIFKISAQGITLKSGMLIDFAECAEVWRPARLDGDAGSRIKQKR